MRKNFYLLLTAAAVIGGTALLEAQNVQSPAKSSAVRNMKSSRPAFNHERNPENTGSLLLVPNETVVAETSSDRSFGPEVKIGETLYDLQTNSSIYRRIHNNGDGTLSAIWTFSAEGGTPWSDRGIAYHFFDGTTWTKLPGYANVDDITAVDPTIRKGFGDLGRVNGVGDIIVSHTSDFLHTSRNTNLSSAEAWISGETDISMLWPRVAVAGPDGKTVHVIALTPPTGTDGTIFNGINGALLYNRSTDGGANWDISMEQAPGVDSSIFKGMGGDSYAIDAKENTVAFVTGDLTTRVMLWKSTDNGTTWDTTTILSFPFEPWNDQITDQDGDGDADEIIIILNPDTAFTYTPVITITVDSTNTPFDSTVTYLDTLVFLDSIPVAIQPFVQDTISVISIIDPPSTQYTVEALFDSILVVNVWEYDTTLVTTFDTTFVITGTGFDTLPEWVTVSDGAFSILIDNDDKVHVWYGGMQMLNSIVGDTSVSYFPGTSGIYYWNEDFVAPVLIADIMDDDGSGVADIYIRYNDDTTVPYGAGLTTFPSAGIDAEGTIYLTYSGAKEGLAYAFNAEGPSFKHIYIMRSADGGQTWDEPTDLVDNESGGFDQLAEYSYCSMARDVDEKVHLLYQRDFYPGSAVTIANGGVHPFDIPNEIIYLDVPRDYVGTKEVKKSEKDQLALVLQPNPAGDFSQLRFELKENTTVSVTVTNLMGQSVMNVQSQKSAAGFHTITLNTAELASGIYLVNVIAGNKTSSAKLIVR